MAARAAILTAARAATENRETRFGPMRNQGGLVDHVKLAEQQSAAAAKASTPAPPQTSTDKRDVTTPPHLIDTTTGSSSSTQQPTTSTKPDTKITGNGLHPKFHQYQMSLGFALGFQTHGVGGVSSVPDPAIEDTEKETLGEAFGNPLVNPKNSCQYHVMLQIQQTVPYPPYLSGFKLKWKRPPGWEWTDGFGDTTFLAVVSNPAVVIRTIQTPAKPTKIVNAGFTVSVLRVYR